MGEERFPWNDYAELLKRAELICRDRDQRGRNHAKPLMEVYSVQDLLCQIKQRHSRLEGGAQAVRLSTDPVVRNQLVEQMVEDCIDAANYAFFLAMKAKYDLEHGRWEP